MTGFPVYETPCYGFNVFHKSYDYQTKTIPKPEYIMMWSRINPCALPHLTMIPIEQWSEFVDAVIAYDDLWQVDGLKALEGE